MLPTQLSPPLHVQHEQPDGTGDPDLLTAAQISLSAAIAIVRQPGGAP